MAFETFLTHEKTKPKRGRRITYLVSLAVHAVLLAIGVAGSYAAVDELAPKGTRVVFLPVLPTPPPPAGGGRKEPIKKTVKKQAKLAISTNKLVAPPDTRPEPATGNEGRVGPGDPNGDPDGVEVTPEPEPIKFVPPSMLKGQLAIDPQADQHRAKLPGSLTSLHTPVSALMRVCVDRDGRVVDVKIIRSDDPLVEAPFISAVRTWRYTPFRIDGRPVPFCTNLRYEVRTTR